MFDKPTLTLFILELTGLSFKFEYDKLKNENT